ncbi:SelT/SelW/SelH family protein [Natronomonas sp. EA1]|uniref:SelT/SelW/SelH family protein n=1 Tax=Natronomonas sp. EA1 TaxID=3421655 RepID=UPI003EBEC389
MKIEIEYCVPCGFLPRTMTLSEKLLRSFGQKLDEVAIVTGDHGVFEVRGDGEVLFDIAEDEYDVDEIVRRVKRAL